MKTVQSYICELDKEMLIEAYMDYLNVKSYELNDVQDYTIRELRDRAKGNVSKYIDRLSKLDITTDRDKKTGIIFAYEVYQNSGWDSDIRIALVHKEELLEKGEVTKNYAFEFTPQSEIMGFYVAENKYTQDNIYEVLAQIIYSASFFGYEQERLEKVKMDLEESIKQVEIGETVDAETLFRELYEEHGWPIPEEDEKKDELECEIRRAIYEFETYCYKKELLRVREQLINIVT